MAGGRRLDHLGARRPTRRMTLRGRVTLAFGAVLVLLTGWGLFPRAEGDGARALAPPPPVTSPPPGTSPRPSGPGSLLPLRPELLAPPVARGSFRPAVDRGGLHIEYTLDPEFTSQVWRVLDRGRVALGHVLVMDPRSGELLAYVSTDPEHFPPDRRYPAASLVKVVTAAALLDAAPAAAAWPCRYRGNPWRLTRRSIDPPARGGDRASLRRALATSNNKCFAQYAVHEIGRSRLVDAIGRFGLLRVVAPVHPPGRLELTTEDPFELGRVGSGLDGLDITPLHALQLAAVLADGRVVRPTWLARIQDRAGADLPIPEAGPGERVLTRELADQLREMLAETTVRGTARRAFRTRRGRPLLRGIRVAGKTGSLNGRNPDGRYEWFIGLAPVERPTLAVATVAVQGPLYWMSASQLAAEVLKVAFCPKGVCRPEPPQARRTRSAVQPVGG